MLSDPNHNMFSNFKARFPDISIEKATFDILLQDAKRELSSDFFKKHYEKAQLLYVADQVVKLQSDAGSGPQTQVSVGSISKSFESDTRFSTPYARELYNLVRTIDIPILVV